MPSQLDGKHPWQQRLEQSLLVKQEHWHSRAKEVADHFEGIDPDGNDFRPTYNKHLAADRNAQAAVLPKRIAIDAQPEQPGKSEHARVQEAAIQFNIRLGRLKRLARDVVYYGLEWGVGCLYTTWGAAGTFAPVEQPDGTGGVGKGSERRDNPDTDPPDAQDALRRATPEFGVGSKWAKYFVIDPNDLFLDPRATTEFNAGWMAHRTWVRRREVEGWADAGVINVKKADLHYASFVGEDLDAQRRAVLQGFNPSTNPAIFAAAVDPVEPGDELWEIFHVFDFVNKQALLLLPGTPKLLRERDYDLGNPYATWRPAATPQRFWALPPAWSYLPAQHTLDDLMTTLVDYASRFGKTVGVFSDEEDTEVLQHFAEAQNAEFAQLRNPEAYRAVSLGDLPPALMGLIPIINQIITEVSGQSEVSSGVISKGDVTATEIERNVAFTSLRMSLLKDAFLEDFLQPVVERTAFLLKKFKHEDELFSLLGIDIEHWTDDEEAELLSDENPGFLSTTQEAIQQKMILTVRAGDAAEAQKLGDRKQAMDLLTAIIPIAGPMGLNILPLLQRILELLDLDSKLITAGAAPAPPPDANVPAPSAGRSPGEQRTGAGNGGMANRDQIDRTGTPSTANTGIVPDQRT